MYATCKNTQFPILWIFLKQMGKEVCPNFPSKTKIQIYLLNTFSTNYVFNIYKL
jgi:hypothetical protein